MPRAGPPTAADRRRATERMRRLRERRTEERRQAELERRRAQRKADEEQRAADAERLRRLREDDDYRERERQRQQQRQLDEANRERERQRQQQRQLDEDYRERERQRQQQRQLDEANRERDRDRADRRRRQRRAQSPSREARHVADVLSGELVVPSNTIGDRDRVCQHCGALLWPPERASLCCAAGKVRLAPLPAPPPSLRQLWTEDSAVARTFRKHVRHLNSALALASQTVQELRPPFGHGGYTPTVVIQGRLYHRLGPLRARDGEVPKFAQMYVHDPQCEDPEAEAALRLGHVRLSANTPAATQRVLLDLLQLLREHNPLVRDFIMASEVPDDQVEHLRLVLSADARPAGEHKRRYNRPDGFQEVSVLIGEEPVQRDIILRRRAAGDGAEDDSQLRAGRLLQEYCCMAFTRVETQRLVFLAMKQRRIRAELYQHLVDAIAGDGEDAAAAGQPAEHGAGDAAVPGQVPQQRIGRRVILPPSFIGSPRHMQGRASAPGRTYLRDFKVIQLRKGSEKLYTKATLDQTSWRTYSLVKASADISRPIKMRTKPRGVNREKIDALCENLLRLIPSHKRQFWPDLQNSAKTTVRDVLGYRD
ncbi:Reticulocyte-binding protein 2 a [Amphibalanus amphitrite]|uniref:Reticulocyte-binding protein 2 a n=1 Tax=Amphibalanus amphitrite TaxID=1232801 RepID=A0A6A4VT97_AMPAM|nr:Reticulocyte-binding protein 2 a [Amphibalanus amphitrite]